MQNFSTIFEIVFLEREREIFIQLHLRNTVTIYKLNTKQSRAHSSQKRLLWSTQNKNIFILFHLKTYELLYYERG